MARQPLMASSGWLLQQEAADGVAIALCADEFLCSRAGPSRRQATCAIADCVGVDALGMTLQVHHMPQVGSCCKGERVLRSVRVACTSEEQAATWRLEILRQIRASGGGGAPEEHGADAGPKRRRLLVIINPRSGQGHAVRVWEAHRPVLEAASITIADVVLTTHASHAREVAAELDLRLYDGVLIVSGDGVMHEVVNGLAARPDADDTFATLCLATIPGGSANSLATSLLKAADEPSEPLSAAAASAAFLIARGNTAPLDLWRVSQPAPGRCGAAFLSLEWALASDIDIGSEEWRWMGSLRFDLYALWRLLTLWTYRGSLRARDAAGGAREFSGPFHSVWACNMRWLTPSAQLAPRAELDDGLADLLVVEVGPRANRWSMLRSFTDLRSGEHAQAPWMSYIKTKSFELRPLKRTSNRPGNLALDGEVWPLADTTVEVDQGRLRLLGTAAPAHGAHGADRA